ncbi:MAG: hypothetical protein V1720_00270 [bacterium]
MRKITTILILFFAAVVLHAQTEKELVKQLGGYNPEELVTLSETITYNQAIAVLSKVSEKLTGKRIVSTIQSTEAIGITIDKIPYMKALLIIVQYRNLMFEERENVIVVRNKDIDTKANLPADKYASVESREVKISALFFEANLSEMRERGINWSWLLSQSGISIGSEFITFGVTDSTAKASTPSFDLNTNTEFEMGNFAGNASAAFRFFESENIGEIIAQPSISVRDGQAGRIQIGSDISIKRQDFAGNVLETFYSTGSIIQVTPYIFTEDGLDYVLCKLDVQRSSANPDITRTEITKTQAATEILLLNGEETVIGGLYTTEESTVRNGIPFLKDLPWWVFGIRYLTGYDSKKVTKKEVMILIKIDIVPTLKERVAQKKSEVLIREQMEKDEDVMNRIKLEIEKKKQEQNTEGEE